MRCHACDTETDFEDKVTGRHYCATCWNVIISTAYSEGFTIEDESDTILVQVLRKETGLDVSQDTPDMSTLWS